MNNRLVSRPFLNLDYLKASLWKNDNISKRPPPLATSGSKLDGGPAASRFPYADKTVPTSSNLSRRVKKVEIKTELLPAGVAETCPVDAFAGLHIATLAARLSCQRARASRVPRRSYHEKTTLKKKKCRITSVESWKALLGERSWSLFAPGRSSGEADR